MFPEGYVKFLPWGSYNRLLQVNSDVNKYVELGSQRFITVAGNHFLCVQLKKLHCCSGCRWFLNSFGGFIVIFVNGAITDFSSCIYHGYEE